MVACFLHSVFYLTVMISDPTHDKYDTRFLKIAFKDGTPKKAFFTACVVGTVLTTINHGDNILAGNFPPLIKIMLTYCVPFCVTTWGSYLGKKAKILQQQKLDAITGQNA